MYFAIRADFVFEVKFHVLYFSIQDFVFVNSHFLYFAIQAATSGRAPIASEFFFT